MLSRLFPTPLLRLAALAVLTILPAPAHADEAEALTEKLLEAIGGRAAWAAVQNTVNDSWQYRSTGPYPVVRGVITMDFTQPRLRIDTTAPDLNVVRAIDGERHWRTNLAGEVGPIPEETLAVDRRWHQGHVYRTLSRLARRDPALRTTIGATGRLEVFEGDVRIAWYALDTRGEPYAYGGPNDDRGGLCGPWEFEAGGIRHPIWTSNPDGTFRARIVALQVNVSLTDATFAPPAP